MAILNQHIKLGISPSMLRSASFDNHLEHLCAVDACCAYPEFETLETFLPDDNSLRQLEIQKMRDAGKTLHYNTPGIFQVAGPGDSGSPDPKQRASALELMKRHIDYAAQAQAPLIVITGCMDRPEHHEDTMKYFEEFFIASSLYAQERGILVVVEPIERHRFKRLVLGPTWECASLVEKARAAGCANAHTMLDIAHLPLMEEDFDSALAHVSKDLAHVHMGDAVLDPANAFYGHTHPPLGVQGGCFDLDALTYHFLQLLKSGYIPSTPNTSRALISFEVQPYPGASMRTTAQLCYEKALAAFERAFVQFERDNA